MFSNSIKLLIFSLIVVFVAGAIFIWLGIFNIAANDKHWTVTTSLLETIRDKSISSRASDIKSPDLSGSERITRAAANYEAMCSQCHLAPGIEKSELYEGLYPQPPVFHKLAKYTRKPEETFWIIKNGIKMTGMPSWGIYNSDKQIWDMVALLTELKNITPEQYNKLVESGEHTHERGGHMDNHHNESQTKKTNVPHHDHDHKH